MEMLNTKLENQRKDIEKITRQYDTLNSAYENSNVNLTSNYYKYIMYTLVAIFLILLFLRYKASSNGEQTGGSHSHKTNLFMYLLLGFIIVLNTIIKINK